MHGGGFDLLERLTESGSDLSVIVISGLGGQETRDKVLSLGAIEFFEKPFDVPELCDAIRRVVESAR